MSNIALALVKAQKAFGPALKGSNNPAFKSKYADLSACVEAVIDSLNENGIFLTQKSVPCDSGVSVETIFLHESGEVFSGGVTHVPVTKQDAHGVGSALTYARRYGLMAACGIAPEDDDGNAAVKYDFDAVLKKAAELNKEDSLALLLEARQMAVKLKDSEAAKSIASLGQKLAKKFAELEKIGDGVEGQA
jgi:hypothetical protein